MTIIAPLRYDRNGDILAPTERDLNMVRGGIHVPFTNEPGHYHLVRVHEIESDQDRFRDKAQRLIHHIRQGVDAGKYILIEDLTRVNHYPRTKNAPASSVLEIAFASIA